MNWTQILTALAPWVGAALLLGVLGFGLFRIAGIARIVGTVLLVATGVILGAAIFLNPGAIGQIVSGTVGAVDPYRATVGAAKAGQEVKRLQTEPDTVDASLAFDCELARAAGQVVNPAWCAQLARARADWNQADLQATLAGLQALQVKIGLVPQGTMLDTGWFDASDVPILVAASPATSQQVRTQIEDLQKVLGQGPAIVSSVAPSSTVTTTARVASGGDLEGWLSSPLGTPPEGSAEWVQQIWHLPAATIPVVALTVIIIAALIFRRR